ncbi:MAG: transposase [Acidobacteriota bacterium]|jgi:hypothetical protein|nr:transposase [Acidobacteriota bacterium]
MEILLKRCAGLDVHKETVVACARRMVGGRVEHALEQFGTTTSELLRLAEWLLAQGVPMLPWRPPGSIGNRCGTTSVRLEVESVG